MRTTLELDDDVAAMLAKVRRERGMGLKQAVNAGLRQGLPRIGPAPDSSAPFRTSSVSLGRCLPGNVDNVIESLAGADGEMIG
jgi:hypothetical protein